MIGVDRGGARCSRSHCRDPVCGSCSSQTEDASPTGRRDGWYSFRSQAYDRHLGTAIRDVFENGLPRNQNARPATDIQIAKWLAPQDVLQWGTDRSSTAQVREGRRRRQPGLAALKVGEVLAKPS